jgi:inactivated superfamily I helicase
VLCDEWIPAPRRLERDEALAELALRFFRGHGPATLAQNARWAGVGRTDLRRGLAAVRGSLTALDVDGTEHLLDPATPELLDAVRAEAAGAFLLPGFDELVLGYADRSAVLDPEFADRIVPGGNGMFRPTVVHRGRIVGTWGRIGSGTRRRVVAEPFTEFDAALTAAIEEQARRLP